MCVAYELNGRKLDYLPAAVEDQIKIKPIYKTFQGWKVSTSGIKNMEKLPENANIHQPLKKTPPVCFRIHGDT